MVKNTAKKQPYRLYYKYKTIHGFKDMSTHEKYWWREQGYDADAIFYEIIFFFPNSHTVYHSMCRPTKRELRKEFLPKYPNAVKWKP